MAIPAKEFFKTLPEDALERAHARAKVLIAEELTLRDLRRARAMTQKKMAELLGVQQENVSRLERRSDLLLSTLTGYVEAMGGSLRLVAEFPDRPPVTLTTYGELAEDGPAEFTRDDVPATQRNPPHDSGVI